MKNIKLKYVNKESKFIEIECGDSTCRLHYRDEGSGPVLLLLHGVCASLHTWDAWVETLKPYYRIIRFDIPGFGLSSPPENDGSFKKLGFQIFSWQGTPSVDSYPGNTPLNIRKKWTSLSSLMRSAIIRIFPGSSVLPVTRRFARLPGASCRAFSLIWPRDKFLAMHQN